jgi:glycosyltransferase involved in cell wall biosynthesis
MSSPVVPTIVVVLSKTFPIPPDAGSPRPFHLIARLAMRARLLCVAGVSEGRERWTSFIEAPEVAGLFASVDVMHGENRQPVTAQPLTFLTKRARHDRRFRDPKLLRGMQALTGRIAQEKGPLSFLCIGTECLQFVPRRLWASCVVDSVDPESLMMERRVREGAGLTPSRRLKLYLAQSALRRFEQRMFDHVSTVTYNSSADIAHLLRDRPDAPIVRVIDGCDTDYFSPDQATNVEEEPDQILFNGHMRYPPNLDAARHLVEKIMPLVWERQPQTSVFLVGPDPEGGLARFRELDRVVVTGFVDDIRPYLKRATIVVSALRVGTGMKNKLQAGLAMGKAMVVSTVTCEGFDELEPGRHALVADEPEEFASHVCALLEDPERRARMGEAGLRLVRENYSWDIAVEALWGAIDASPRCGGEAHGSP